VSGFLVAANVLLGIATGGRDVDAVVASPGIEADDVRGSYSQ
jgi:hypothetical protein